MLVFGGGILHFKIIQEFKCGIILGTSPKAWFRVVKQNPWKIAPFLQNQISTTETLQIVSELHSLLKVVHQK